MVTMVTKQKIFDQLTFCETFKDGPIPHKNFTLLGQESHEIPGGCRPGPLPWYPMWVPIPLVTEGLKSKRQIHNGRYVSFATRSF